MAISFTMAMMLLFACQKGLDAGGGDDDDNDDDTPSSGVVVVPISMGGEQVSSETTVASATRVSLNPSSSAAFFWSSDEYFTAVDMTDNYHSSAISKLCEMAAEINTTTNSAWFTFDMSVQGLNTNLSYDVGTVNFYAYTPRREYNYRYDDMIKLVHTAPDMKDSTYNNDYLLLTYPMDRIFNVDASASVSEAYHLYGRFLPFVAIPLVNKQVTWTKYDEQDYELVYDEDGNISYDEDGNPIYITGSASFSSGDKFNFAPLFHTVMVRIYPILTSDEDYAFKKMMVNLDVHKSVTTVSLTDSEEINYFRAGDLLNMQEMSYNSHIPTMIGNARVSMSEDNQTFIDSDGEQVSDFSTANRQVSSTIRYFSENINPVSVEQNGDTYNYTYEDGLAGASSSELYDGSNHQTTVSLMNRIAEGVDYMVIPVIATRSYDRVSAFNVNAKFYDKDDNLLLEISRDVEDNSDTRDYWYYGSQSIIRLYEDPEEMGSGFGEFKFALSLLVTGADTAMAAVTTSKSDIDDDLAIVSSATDASSAKAALDLAVAELAILSSAAYVVEDAATDASNYYQDNSMTASAVSALTTLAEASQLVAEAAVKVTELAALETDATIASSAVSIASSAYATAASAVKTIESLKGDTTAAQAAADAAQAAYQEASQTADSISSAN